MGVGRAALALVALVACRGQDPPPAASRPTGQTVKVAVIGGMIETGFWQALAERYQAARGNRVEVVAAGPKPQVVDAFRKGGIELITVHACDAMINLVADGVARDPQPWARNDLVIVGPAADPARIRGEHDAVAAIARIVAARAPLLVHASLGADSVLHDLQEAGHIVLDPGATVMFGEDNQHRVIERAAQLSAYTMIGRIPWVTGKLKAAGVELMVQGDPRLRRPYLVEVSAAASPAALDLAAYLRSPETQQWIATFGRGKYDDQPLFFPVSLL
ncbi:MAG TPA: substrate-binding domain-containing protein [Kofleriaceae bacterium]